MSLPQPVVEVTLLECAGCLQQFMAHPPQDQVLRPIVLASKSAQHQPIAAPRSSTRAVKPIVLPPRSKQRQVPYTPPPVQSTPPDEAPVYAAPPASRRPVQYVPPPQEAIPIVEPYLTSEDDDSSAPPVTTPRKKKPKRFKKKKQFRADSSEESSDLGTRIGAAILLLIIMVIIGAVSGVGRFGWLKSNRIVDFNDKVVSILDKTTVNMTSEAAWAWNEVFIRRVSLKIKPGIQELTALSVPSEGNEFHQAALRFLQRLDALFSHELIQLSQQAPQGDRRQMERHAEQQMERLVAELTALEDAVIKAQADMARRNGFELSDSPNSTLRRRRW